MLFSASSKLEMYIDLLNQINVFPVPDGDTGLNMFHTFQSAVEMLMKNNTQHCGEIIGLISEGAFNGCVGCSGLILTEYFHGLADIWVGYEELNTQNLTEGFLQGANYAFQAITNPKEGTILTVMRLVAEAAKTWSKLISNPYELLSTLFEIAKAALFDTHNLLPQARKAGVIDSGAMGFVFILEGFLDSLKDCYSSTREFKTIDKDLRQFLCLKPDLKSIEPEYELLVKINDLRIPLEQLKTNIRFKGNSILVLPNDSSPEFKIHIHCKNPNTLASELKYYCKTLEILSIQPLHQQAINFHQYKKIRGGKSSS